MKQPQKGELRTKNHSSTHRRKERIRRNIIITYLHTFHGPRKDGECVEEVKKTTTKNIFHNPEFKFLTARDLAEDGKPKQSRMPTKKVNGFRAALYSVVAFLLCIHAVL